MIYAMWQKMSKQAKIIWKHFENKSVFCDHKKYIQIIKKAKWVCLFNSRSGQMKSSIFIIKFDLKPLPGWYKNEILGDTEEKHHYKADELHYLYLLERLFSKLLSFNASFDSISRHFEKTLVNIPLLNQTFVEFNFFKKNFVIREFLGSEAGSFTINFLFRNFKLSQNGNFFMQMERGKLLFKNTHTRTLFVKCGVETGNKIQDTILQIK